jgi:phospholipid/cholesterol/gamma-HCH transport system ATP-binding protein
MMSTRPVLEIADAVADSGAPDATRMPPVTLTLRPGDFALVDAGEPRRAAWFADLCSGLIVLASGTVRFLGREWSAMTRDYAGALRGRIGRVFGAGGWIEFVDVTTNILLPQLHHTRRDPRELRDDAARHAQGFGLPGLPLGYPRDLSAKDLACAGFVRALLGEPALLLLESPLQGRFAELAAPLLDALTAARQNGAAAIWLTSSDLVWPDRSLPVTQRLRLRDYGLISAGRAA